ncbi:MAG: hypothetical protein KC910_11870, partial [Candidatus Eremiobacteraeota bacterium]|nr:hypothetical protein [Candidatus Eremiobacteraeota bacterium]
MKVLFTRQTRGLKRLGLASLIALTSIQAAMAEEGGFIDVLKQHENNLFLGMIGLGVALVVLIVAEVVLSKRESSSSLDIDRLAAAAQRKQQTAMAAAAQASPG